MINRLSTVVLLVALSLIFPLVSHADPTYNPQIKIKLTRFFPIGTETVDITSTEAFGVTDQNGTSVAEAPANTLLTFSSQSTVDVTVIASGSTNDSEAEESGMGGSGLFLTVTTSPGGLISVSTPDTPLAVHHYHGSLILYPGLNLVNVLPLEDYLKGVLKPEIGADAPAEALKAQAVASRTYTIFNMGKMVLSGADMDDTTRTQSYLGADGETDSIDNAVDSTAGEVILYNGMPINALFSTDCGGMTAQGGINEPYLLPVKDPECEGEAKWKLDLTTDQADSLLGESAGSTKIKIVQTDSSGRVTALKVDSADDEKTISGSQFRKEVGYDRLRSTHFKISQLKDGSFHIVGEGWGHGLGLCQHGAIYLAEHSALYTEILKHYYSGTTLGQLSTDMLPSQPIQPMVTPVQPLSSPPAP